MNPSIKLRGGPSGPNFSPSTPGHVLTIQADGESVKPELGQVTTTRTAMTVPALTASFADVAVFPGFSCQPSDVFAILMDHDVAVPRLANVAAVAAWCAIANQVTVRFFGTTAGGSQLIALTKVATVIP
jgi:hypothetical protein